MFQAWAEIAKGPGPIAVSELRGSVDRLFAVTLRAMADRFGVSQTAMRIRLRQVGLLVQDCSVGYVGESGREFGDSGQGGVYVRHLAPEAFEKEAKSFTDDYHKCRPVPGLPVPVEDMLEHFFKIRIGFGDLKQRYGLEGILAALRLEDREVIVDESLEPKAHPKMRGRYAFTLAHGLGQLHLHRRYLDESRGSVLIRRNGGVKTPLEAEADHFAARLLMPWDEVHQTWAEIATIRGPIYAEHLRGDLLEWFTATRRAMAERFGVSQAAMEIRLGQVGLLIQEITADCAAKSGREFSNQFRGASWA